MGNHDGAAIGTVDPAYFNPDARAAIEWTAGVLDANARAYLATLPEVRSDGDMTAVHGSPRDPIWEYISGAARRRRELRGLRDAALPVRPYPSSGRVPRGRTARSTARIGLPGTSARPATGRGDAQPGQRRAAARRASRRGVRDPRARRRSDGSTFEFRRVRYDIDRTQRLMREAGLPAAPRGAAQLRSLIRWRRVAGVRPALGRGAVGYEPEWTSFGAPTSAPSPSTTPASSSRCVGDELVDDPALNVAALLLAGREGPRCPCST